MALTILPKCDSYANRSPLLSPLVLTYTGYFAEPRKWENAGKRHCDTRKGVRMKFRTNITLTLKDRKDLRLVLKNTNVYLYFKLYLKI